MHVVEWFTVGCFLKIAVIKGLKSKSVLRYRIIIGTMV